MRQRRAVDAGIKRRAVAVVVVIVGGAGDLDMIAGQAIFAVAGADRGSFGLDAAENTDLHRLLRLRRGRGRRQLQAHLLSGAQLEAAGKRSEHVADRLRLPGFRARGFQESDKVLAGLDDDRLQLVAILGIVLFADLLQHRGVNQRLGLLAILCNLPTGLSAGFVLRQNRGPELSAALGVDHVGFRDISLHLVIGQHLAVLVGQEAAAEIENAGGQKLIMRSALGLRCLTGPAVRGLLVDVKIERIEGGDGVDIVRLHRRQCRRDPHIRPHGNEVPRIAPLYDIVLNDIFRGQALGAGLDLIGLLPGEGDLAFDQIAGRARLRCLYDRAFQRAHQAAAVLEITRCVNRDADDAQARGADDAGRDEPFEAGDELPRLGVPQIQLRKAALAGRYVDLRQIAQSGSSHSTLRVKARKLAVSIQQTRDPRRPSS